MIFNETDLDLYIPILKDENVAIVDVDGVVLNIDHRLPHILGTKPTAEEVRSPKGDWPTFHSLAHLDTAAAAAKLIKTLHEKGHFTIVFLTARSFHTEPTALEMCLRRELGLKLGDYLCVMKNTTIAEEHSVDYKRRTVRRLLAAGINVEFAIDDQHALAVMFAEEGIPSLRLYNHVDPNHYGF